jgi:O-antigen/teichoic acid export membrane protein
MFGPQFTAGYALMFVLCVGVLARAAVGPAERLLNMLGEQRACAAVYAAAFAVALVACLLLVPQFGALGAGAAMSGAMMLESVLLYAVARRRLGLHVFVWSRS